MEEPRFIIRSSKRQQARRKHNNNNKKRCLGVKEVVGAKLGGRN